MSFDVFFKGFRDGEVIDQGGSAMRRVLDPYVVAEQPENDFLQLQYSDVDRADVYLDERSMMVNHVSGEFTWDLLVEGAIAAGWVIMPIGCPTCITDEAQRAHLPPGLAGEAVVVRDGDDLIEVFESC